MEKEEQSEKQRNKKEMKMITKTQREGENRTKRIRKEILME